VQKGLNLEIILFIVSEALFFRAIFWAYFHSALTPAVELGAQWLPLGLKNVNLLPITLYSSNCEGEGEGEGDINVYTSKGESKKDLRGPLTPSEKELKKHNTFLGLLTPSEQEEQRRNEWINTATPEQLAENERRLQRWLENTTPLTPSRWEKIKEKFSSFKNKFTGFFKNSSNNNHYDDNSGNDNDGGE
jgi:hypothetical protein